jgi:putative ABC transport system permease protein
LLTADVQVAAGNAWNDQSKSILDRYAKSPLVAGMTSTVELASMLRPVGDAAATPRMVEIKAVQDGFPFYGELTLSDNIKYTHQLLRGQGILVKPSLLTALNVKLGDAVKLGTLQFTIRGVIDREPGNSLNAFSFGPRVMIDYDDAVAAGLTTFGSRARYRVLFKASPGQMDDLLLALKKDFELQPLVNVRSFRFSQDRMSESLTQVEDYLSLVGLIILVLGGIGISSVTRVFIQQKMKSIAILKCLGGGMSGCWRRISLRYWYSG